MKLLTIEFMKIKRSQMIPSSAAGGLFRRGKPAQVFFTGLHERMGSHVYPERTGLCLLSAPV